MKDGKEAELWSEVSPEMMSDEEREGEGYVCHQPHYRSRSLNSFIKKLDSRLDSTKKKKKNIPDWIVSLDPPMKSPYQRDVKNG